MEPNGQEQGRDGLQCRHPFGTPRKTGSRDGRSPGVEMVEVGVGMEMQSTSPNQSPPTSTPERLPLDYQLDTNSPNLSTLNRKPQNLTIIVTLPVFKLTS